MCNRTVSHEFRGGGIHAGIQLERPKVVRTLTEQSCRIGFSLLFTGHSILMHLGLYNSQSMCQRGGSICTTTGSRVVRILWTPQLF
jgi:hypothetical protein